MPKKLSLDMFGKNKGKDRLEPDKVLQILSPSPWARLGEKKIPTGGGVFVRNKRGRKGVAKTKINSVWLRRMVVATCVLAGD